MMIRQGIDCFSEETAMAQLGVAHQTCSQLLQLLKKCCVVCMQDAQPEARELDHMGCSHAVPSILARRPASLMSSATLIFKASQRHISSLTVVTMQVARDAQKR